ncbi:MAG TPA: prohibitin family protein [Magnetospirillaceae bacterium]|nr:prohibitin family protein [Magnetospirillaceae bacterium]
MRDFAPKYTVPAVLAGSVLFFASNSFYTVDPTDVAEVRRLGTVVTPQPVGPGLHFKLPLIDRVDRLRVSLDTLPISNLTVYTVDNQSVGLGLTMTYRIPKSAVYHLLYEVGGTGNVDIHTNIIPVVSDRALRVFAKRNTVKISAEREDIANEMKASIAERVHEIFGVEVVDLQISSIGYSPTFVASVEAAVKAKNDAIAAENNVNRIRYEGEQAKVRAEAQAVAAVTAAEAEKKVKVLQADADAYAIGARGDALKKNPALIEMTIAEKWDGKLPQQMVPGAAVPFLNLTKQ